MAEKKQTVDGLIDKIEKYVPKADLDMVRIAYDFADAAHEGQTRKSGEPYITHPLAAAHLLAEMRIDPSIVTAALLHDVPEDTDITLSEIEENFGEEIMTMVEGITKLGNIIRLNCYKVITVPKRSEVKTGA